MEDPLRDIFSRLSCDPGGFASLCVASKAWRRIIVDEENFLRPFRIANSGAPPPLLGLYADALYDEVQFFPTINSGAINFPAPPPEFEAYGCTHGRLLLRHDTHGELLLVWDPMTGEQHVIPTPPPGFHNGLSCGAALVCDADHGHHADCHASQFRVVFAYSEAAPPGGWHPPMEPLRTFAYVYNSETRTWGDRPAATISVGSYFDRKPSAVARNGAAVYWMIEVGEISHVLGFHLGTQGFVLEEPSEDIPDVDDFVLAPTVDAGLRLAGVMDEFVVSFTWEDGAWVDRAVVRLDDLLPLQVYDQYEHGGDGNSDDEHEPRVIGFSEESNSIFLQAEPGVYIINLESGQHRRVLETDQHLSYVYPYYSFYTAAGKAILNDVQVEQEINNIQSGGEINVTEEQSSNGGAE